MAGAHRRIRLEDLLAYKTEKKVPTALKEMVAISPERGLE
jgi:hypothetical protein